MFLVQSSVRKCIVFFQKYCGRKSEMGHLVSTLKKVFLTAKASHMDDLACESISENVCASSKIGSESESEETTEGKGSCELLKSFDLLYPVAHGVFAHSMICFFFRNPIQESCIWPIVSAKSIGCLSDNPAYLLRIVLWVFKVSSYTNL